MAAASADEGIRLEHALSQLELARIDTIHAFCGDLLRERPVEAGIDPLFAVAAEDAAKRLAEQAFEGWFEEILGDPPEGVRRVLRRRSKGGEQPRDSLRNALTRLIEHRDFPGPWRRDAFDRNRQLDCVVTKLRSIGALRRGQLLARRLPHPKPLRGRFASSRRTIAPKRSKAGIMTLWKRPCAN